MVVCKFFLQGRCKYGNRCYNEHIRNTSFNDDHYTGQQHRQHNRRYNDNKSAPRQDYIKPSNFSGNPRNNQENFTSPFSRGNQQQPQKSPFENQQQPQKSPFENQSDRFHWKKQSSNRFEALNEVNQDISQSVSSEDQLIISSIQKDMQEWNNCSMWPYSCYFIEKTKRCVQGLPDILAEELRTLYYIRGEEAYRGIIHEVNAIYTRRKEELIEMSPETRESVLTDAHTSSESNPSSCLTIMSMYGTGAEFPTSSSVSLPPSSQKQTSSEQNISVLPQSMILPLVASGDKTAPETPKPALVTSDAMFTDKSLLTDDEIEQFQASSFTLGKIPLRPPPSEYCK